MLLKDVILFTVLKNNSSLPILLFIANIFMSKNSCTL